MHTRHAEWFVCPARRDTPHRACSPGSKRSRGKRRNYSFSSPMPRSRSGTSGEDTAGEQNDRADDDFLPGARHAHQDQAVDDDQDHAEECAKHRAGSTCHSSPTKHHGGDHIQFGADQIERVGESVARGVYQPTQPGEQSGITKHEQLHRAHAEAQSFRNRDAATEGINGATRKCAIQDVSGHTCDQNQDQHAHRQ